MLQACLDGCLTQPTLGDETVPRIVSPVTFVRMSCDGSTNGAGNDCLLSHQGDLVSVCADQCAHRSGLERDLYLGAHPDDVAQPEPPPLLALVFEGPPRPMNAGCDAFESVAEAVTKQAVASQPAVQRCFLEEASGEMVPDWVDLQITYDLDGRVVRSTGTGEHKTLVACLGRVAAAWTVERAMPAAPTKEAVTMVASLRRDRRAVRFAGLVFGLRRGIDLSHFEPFLSSEGADRLARFKRNRLRPLGLEHRFTELLMAVVALLAALLFVIILRRWRTGRTGTQSG